MYTKFTYIVGALIAILLGSIADSALANQQVMTASYYSEGDGCLKCPVYYDKNGQPYHLMANGKRFNDDDPTIVASLQHDLEDRLRVTNPVNGRSIIVIVQDRGPYIKDEEGEYTRDLDLSKGAKEKLNLHIPDSGAAEVLVEELK